MQKDQTEKPNPTPNQDGMRGYTCIVCPSCCELKTDGREVFGARCKRGEEFARQEAVEPLRVLTTTLRCETEDGVTILPVKTASAVPLARVREIIRRIKDVHLPEVPPIGTRLTIKPLPDLLEVIVTGDKP